MELGALDEDQLIPDANGSIDISNRSWVTLDDSLWTHGHSLLYLNLSHNEILTLNIKLGNFYLLRELDLSYNRLETIPDEIGNCKELRIFKCTNNILQHLPTEIQWCRKLTDIDVSENVLESVPRSLGKLQDLTRLNVQHNRLRNLPETLCDCTQLTTILCHGNDLLLSVPVEIRDNTALVLWICTKSKDHVVEIEELTGINATLEDMARLADEEKMKLKDEILRLEGLKEDLEKERPFLYLKMKKGIKKGFKTVCPIM